MKSRPKVTAISRIGGLQLFLGQKLFLLRNFLAIGLCDGKSLVSCVCVLGAVRHCGHSIIDDQQERERTQNDMRLGVHGFEIAVLSYHRARNALHNIQHFQAVRFSHVM